MHIYHNNEARSRNRCRHGKAIIITYSERESVCVRACVCGWVGVGARARACACARVALLIQHAARRHIVICGLWLYHIFQHYLINGTIFGKNLLNIKCVFWFYLQLLFETFLILRRIQRDIVINVKSRQVNNRYSIYYHVTLFNIRLLYLLSGYSIYCQVKIKKFVVVRLEDICVFCMAFRKKQLLFLYIELADRFL